MGAWYGVGGCEGSTGGRGGAGWRRTSSMRDDSLSTLLMTTIGRTPRLRALDSTNLVYAGESSSVERTEESV
jgi:hypothetical protein